MGRLTAACSLRARIRARLMPDVGRSLEEIEVLSVQPKNCFLDKPRMDMGSSLVISYIGLTSRCARLFQWDVFRWVEVFTLVPAVDPRSR